MIRSTFAALAAMALTLGCSSTTNPPAGGTPDSGSSLMPRTYAPTLSAIHGEILSQKCAIPFCHLGTAGAPMPLSTPMEAYQQLVSVPAGSGAGGALSKCVDGGAGAGLLRVDPGHPETSLLYLKVEVPPPAGLCGDTMPGGGQPGLDPKDIAQIQQWIMAGAQNN